MSSNINAIERKPERHGSRFFFVSLVILLLAGACAWFYMNSRPTYAAVTERKIVGLVPVNGEVVAPPSAQAVIPAPFRTQVNKIRVSVGDVVKRGDVLVELSLPSFEAATQQASAALKAAETAYANASRQYDASIKDAKNRLDSARTAERNLRDQQTNNAHPPDPDAGMPIPQAGNTDLATSSGKDAEAAYSQAISERDSALVPYKYQLDAARETYRDAKAGSKMSLVRAPIKGTVTVLNAKPGQEAGVDQKIPIAVIVNLDALQIQAPLASNQIGAAKRGTEVFIHSLDTAGDEFSGKVSRVVSQVVSRFGGLKKEEQNVALIDFDNKNGVLRPGMKVTGGIKTGEVQQALAVPNDAVTADQSGRPVVNVLKQGNWQPVVVETGISDGEYTEIKSGLSQGETVQVRRDLLNAAGLKKP